jgi:Uma2 family endonuclease
MIAVRPAIHQGLTLEEFLALPEAEPALEYDGKVTQKVSPKGRHATLQLDLGSFFNRVGQPGKLARAFTELRTTFAGRSYVPDIAVYRWERIPRAASGEVGDEFFLPPDIAVEIASPDQSRRKLREKCRWYVKNGVPLALLVDPDDRVVAVYRPGARTRTLRGADEIDFGVLLPGVRLAAQEVFGWLQLA